MDVADLEGRLRVLEAERAVLDTLHRSAQSIDDGHVADWVDCLTSTGVFDIRREHPPGQRIEGRDRLVAFVAAHTRAPDHLHKHLVLVPRVEVDGRVAVVHSYLARLDLLRSTPVVRSFGRYRDRLVECPDGRWRIEERVAEVQARHPWS